MTIRNFQIPICDPTKYGKHEDTQKLYESIQALKNIGVEISKTHERLDHIKKSTPINLEEVSVAAAKFREKYINNR